MKKILVTAGGTATAWHIASVVRDYFAEQISIHLCDINESLLVPGTSIVSKVHRVPLSSDNGYRDSVERVIKDEGIDVIVPLIPEEAFLFAEDARFVKDLSVQSAAPICETIHKLVNKGNLFLTMEMLGIPSPTVYEEKNISDRVLYMVKPRYGFGSSGIELLTGKQIRRKHPDPKHSIITEYCHENDYDEVTVEVFNGSIGLHTYARRRVETRGGVCVKMQPVDDSPFKAYIERLVGEIKCPVAFNVQFLHHNGKWKLFDCNLRLGAGTALSTAAGFQLTRAFLAEMAGLPVQECWLHPDPDVKSVLRVYQEIVIK